MATITSLTAQQQNTQRVNIFVDGKYRFSLDMFQISELGICAGKEYSEEELVALEEESVFGKLYARALEYTFIRPHSAKEIRDYLWKKTRDVKFRSKKTGEIKTRAGVSQETANRVYDRLVEKKYIDDEAFARYWVENRNQRKGASLRKLEAELRAKGVTPEIIHQTMQNSTRDEKGELQKIIAKRASKYDNPKKLMAYLVRQGFSYDDIRSALSDAGDEI